MEDFKSDIILKLNDSKKLLHLVNEKQVSIYKSNNEINKILNKLKFLIVSINNHLQYFQNLQTSTTIIINDLKSQKDECVLQIINDIKHLNGEIDDLKKIKINEKLNSNKDLENLFSFISIDDINEFVEKVNFDINDLNIFLDFKLLNNLILKFNKEFENFNNDKKVINSIYKNLNILNDRDKILNDNSTLETEIISYMKQMNSHFDDCILYESNMDPILFTKIQKFNKFDSNLIFNSLKNNCNMMIENFSDLEKFFKKIKNLNNLIKLLLLDINKFIENVIDKQLVNNLINKNNEFKIKIEELNNSDLDILDYINNFKQFKKSYSNLIDEIKRRINLNSNIEKLIKNFQNQLNDLESNDKKIRDKFITENSDFLPQNIINFDFIESKFPKIYVNYTLEDLPNEFIE